MYRRIPCILTREQGPLVNFVAALPVCAFLKAIFQTTPRSMVVSPSEVKIQQASMIRNIRCRPKVFLTKS